MPAKRFNEADIDFDAIDGELAKLVPPKLNLTDVLDRLRKRLVEKQAEGVTVAQMHEVLTAGGINITERSLRTFLDKGVLPGRKVAEAARTVVSEEGSDPFRRVCWQEWRQCGRNSGWVHFAVAGLEYRPTTMGPVVVSLMTATGKTPSSSCFAW